MHFPKRLPSTLGSTSQFKIINYLTEHADYAVALSSSNEVGVTWNPDSVKRPNGNPQVFGHQQWFILPEPIAQMLLSGPSFSTNNKDN